MEWLLFAASCLLTLSPGGTRPLITPRTAQLAVDLNEAFSLSCRDNGVTRWRRGDRPLRSVLKERDGTFKLNISRAQMIHMGRYICENEKTLEQSTIYVFVRDPQNVFKKIFVNDILAGEGSNCVIPCLPTDPEVSNFQLTTCDGRPLAPGLHFNASVEHGVTINNVQISYQGCYMCTGLLGGMKVESSHFKLTIRPLPAHHPVISVSSEPTVILVVGQSFRLSCGTTNINSNFTLTWGFPPGMKAEVTNKQQILSESMQYQWNASFEISTVQLENSGVYRCEARNQKGASSTSVHLRVYERAFIQVLNTSKDTILVHAEDTLSLWVELLSYPVPEGVVWLCQGVELQNSTDHVVTWQKNGYRYSSELRLVRVKSTESGAYAFQAWHSETAINRSFTLSVISKPQIVAQYGPQDGQVSCIAEGFPKPNITWFQCQEPHTRCSQLLNSSYHEENEVSTEVVTKPAAGRWKVASRLNVSRGSFQTVECVATVLGKEDFFLFSINERTVPHQLFTPLVISLVSAATLLFLFLLVLLYKYLQKPKYQIQWKVIEAINGNNYVYIDPAQLPYDHQWEFPRDKLRFGKTLGSGAFGKVVEATAYGMCKVNNVMIVAVKMLKPSAHATEKEALMSELKVLSYLGHHMNIVNLLGACTVGGPTLLITEYCCFGDLLNFLRRKREMFFCSKLGEDCYYKNILQHQEAVSEQNRNGYMTMRPSVVTVPLPATAAGKGQNGGAGEDKDGVSDILLEDNMSLDTEDLLSFSYQVAKGMDFLASKNCIHRDLAARNILLTEGRVAKICDFGLARDITTDSNYVVKGNARLPVKWMSPESIFDCVYTFESDVWSYGILLWEIFSLGSSPYPGMPVDSKFYKLIKEGYRMDEPEFAPKQMYEIMSSCWDADPLRRPAFGKIVDRIEQQLSDSTKHVYLNLSSRFVPRNDSLGHFLRLNSVGSSTASTQPLLVSEDSFHDEPICPQSV